MRIGFSQKSFFLTFVRSSSFKTEVPTCLCGEGTCAGPRSRERVCLEQVARGMCRGWRGLQGLPEPCVQAHGLCVTHVGGFMACPKPFPEGRDRLSCPRLADLVRAFRQIGRLKEKCMYPTGYLSPFRSCLSLGSTCQGIPSTEHQECTHLSLQPYDWATRLLVAEPRKHLGSWLPDCCQHQHLCWLVPRRKAVWSPVGTRISFQGDSGPRCISESTLPLPGAGPSLLSD